MSLPTYATNLAVINKANNNTVSNIAWGYAYDTSWIGANEDLVAVDDLAVQVGDTYNYTDQHFYHEGVIVKSVEETHADEEAALMDEIEDLCEEIIGE